MPKKLNEQDIKNLVKENENLKKENYAYKQVVSSRRFRYAEKIATVYNQFFPKSTKRRYAFEHTCGVFVKPIDAIADQGRKKIIKKISRLSKPYDKVMVIDSIPWDDRLKQRPHHLAREFAKLGFFVIYFEPSNYMKKFRIIDKNIVTVNSYIYLLDVPKSHPKKSFFLLPNTMATALDIVKEVRKSGYSIIYEYIDEFHGDISGDLSVQLTIWNELKKIKPVLCVASARKLEDDLRSHLGNKQKIVLAPNAVYTEHFDFTNNKTENPPTDLEGIVKRGNPIVGFYGALAPWIDFKIINNLAREHKDLEIVLLGIDYNGAAKNLERLNNVHDLGPKKYEELPKYAKYFNCAIIPFKHGQIAKATSPIKLFEYMAAGLPTVCTRDLRECRGFDYVYMAKDDDEFIKDIYLALDNYKNIDCRKRLLKQAEENTWSERAKTIVEAIK